MADNTRNHLTNKLLSKSRRVQYVKTFVVLGLCVAAAVAFALHYTGIAMTHEEKVLSCPVAERIAEAEAYGETPPAVAHTHDDSCYDKDGNLVCPLEEKELHEHTDECYTTEEYLICGLEETEGHVHTDECYDENGELICGLEETEGHTHTDECYETESILTCDKEEVTEEHVHGSGCFETVIVRNDEDDASALADSADGEDDSSSDEDHSDDEGDSSESEDRSDEEDAEHLPAQSFEQAVLNKKGNEILHVVVEAPEGALPEGTTMEVTRVKSSDYADAVSEALVDAGDERNVDSMQAVDIVFRDADGNEIEPLCPISVSMTSDKIGNEGTSPVLVHVNNDGKGEVVDQLSDKQAAKRKLDTGDDTLSFDSDSFSVYIIAYTVDFHWEVDGNTYEFSLPGGGFVSFRKLVDVLGIVDETQSEDEDVNSETDNVEKDDEDTAADDENADNVDAQSPDEVLSEHDGNVSEEALDFVDEVENVEFSNLELLWVGKVDSDTTVGEIKSEKKLDVQYSAELTEEQIDGINSTEVQVGDWALISLLPFLSEESLIVTMKTGEVFTIKVTDAQISNRVLTADGKSYEITVTYGEDAQIPEGSELKVEEILKENERYAEYFKKTISIVDPVLSEEDVSEKDTEDVPVTEQIKDAFDGLVETVIGTDGDDNDSTSEDYARMFDIQIWNKEERIEPQAEVRVDIRLLDAPEDDEISPKVVHFAETGPEEMKVSPSVEEGEDTPITFMTDEFSVYSVIYTVDFTWEVDGQMYDFSLPGGGVVSLRELSEVLGIVDSTYSQENTDNSEESSGEEALLLSGVNVSKTTKRFVSDIESVEFSNPELVWVGKVDETCTVGEIKEANNLNIEYSPEVTISDIDEMDSVVVNPGDWLLVSLQPFETEESLTITMKNGDEFTIVVKDPNPDGSGTLMDSSNYVDVYSDGITIKLFDYSGTVKTSDNWWDPAKNIDDVWGNATNYSKLRAGEGINKGKTLLFSGSGLSGGEWWNDFTGVKSNDNSYYSGIVTQGIVAPTLDGNGYPRLSSKVIQESGNNDAGLGYLFGTGGQQDGVVKYDNGGKGLTGLLQKDNNGYYYYDSERNYAQLTDNQISLYTDTYYKAAGKSNSKTENIGFFPFDEYNSNYKEEKTPNINNGSSNVAAYNHQFGMSVSGHFTYPTQGYLPDATGNPDPDKAMVFEFEGDDDVWVFIDGVLVLDLGGVHSPVKGSINFATGEVKIGEFDSDGNDIHVKDTTIEAMFRAAGKTWNPGDYSDHKFDFFYIERGGCDSNCRLTFNLLTRPENEEKGKLVFDKVDEDQHPLENAKFQLFTNAACTTALTWAAEDESGVKTAVAVSSADDSGNVKFENIPTGNYYMKEIEAPEGYITSDRVYAVHIDATDGNSWVKYNGNVENAIANSKLKLTLEKVDDAGTLVRGASFKLIRKYENSTETIPTDVLSAAAQQTLNNLQPGEYELIETQAPNGYTALTGSIKFTVTTNSITLTEKPEGVTYDNDALVLTLPNKLTYDDNEIVVKKKWVDIDNNTVDGGNKSATVQLRRYCYENIEGEFDSHNVYIHFVFPDSGWNHGDAIQNRGPYKIKGSKARITWNAAGVSFFWDQNYQNYIGKDSYSVIVDLNKSNDFTFYSTENWGYQNLSTVSVEKVEVQSNLEIDTGFPSTNDTSATQTLESGNDWSYKWKIGNSDDCAFPAYDEHNRPYYYYIVELDANGNEIQVENEVSDGINLKSIYYTPSQVEDGGLQNGSITVINEVEKQASIDITLKKVDKDDIDNESANTLENATFRLEKYDTSNYRNKNWECTINDSENESPGVFSFTNLSEGYYKLVEETCPVGYVKTSNDPKFRIKSDEKGRLVVLLLDDDGNAINNESVDYIRVDNTTITFGNEVGIALPSTGSIGTTIFTVLGTIMIAGSSILLLMRFRGTM